MNSISLLVPCYNAENYILPFLKNLSLLNQKFAEVLFYDDCSTDNTVSLLLQNNQKIIKGISNKGPGFARNKLSENATCQYIHFHDIDDEFNPNFLDLINCKIKEEDFDVIIGYADWIDENTRKSIILWKYNIDQINHDKLSYFLTHPLGIINTVYKKDIFNKSGGFNEEIKCWEDTDLHVKMAALNANFGVINKVIAFSIRHNSGISKNQSKCWYCRLNFLTQYVNLYPSYKTIIASQIAISIHHLIELRSYKYAIKGIHQLKKINHLRSITPNHHLQKLLNFGFPPLIILIFRFYSIKYLSKKN